jgi:predicted transposase/invertase (TIGR01784 family)
MMTVIHLGYCNNPLSIKATSILLFKKRTKNILSFKNNPYFCRNQLPFFDKKEEECVTNLDKWIYNLKHMERLTQLPFGADGGVFKLLDEVTDVDSLNKEERREYEHTLKVFRDLRGALDGADQKGYNRGIQEGILQTARNMKALGISIDTIKQVTHLTDEEIQSI